MLKFEIYRNTQDNTFWYRTIDLERNLSDEWTQIGEPIPMNTAYQPQLDIYPFQVYEGAGNPQRFLKKNSDQLQCKHCESVAGK